MKNRKETEMDNAFHPLVSIIIPVYNGANYMREAIDSALAQTYRNIEIIVVNDGSNDNGETERIALSYGDKIKYFHKENGGVSSALNLGIQNMQGEYFSWLSHDDKYSPEKIQNQINTLAKYAPNDRLISLCEDIHINEHSEPLSKIRRKKIDENRIISGKEVLHHLFSCGCFCGCALLIPKGAFDECGKFNEQLRFSQDYLMWIQLFMQGYSLIYNANPDVQMRIHNKQLTQTGQNVFHKDSEVICDIIAPRLVEMSLRDDNLLYYFTLNNAKYNNRSCVQKCMQLAKERQIFGFFDRCNLKLMTLYGKVRPCMKKIYYKFTKKV